MWYSVKGAFTNTITKMQHKKKGIPRGGVNGN